MKWGTFIGINFETRVVTGANQVQCTQEEYLRAKGFKSHRDVIGPFELIISSKLEKEGKPFLDDESLHQAALAEARAMQRRLADKLKKSDDLDKVDLE